MSQPNAIAISTKLDGPSNYRGWAFSVKTVLRGFGLASHLTDDPPVDTSKDGSGAAAVKSWRNDVGRVMSAIVTSMKSSLIMSLENYNTAKEVGISEGELYSEQWCSSAQSDARTPWSSAE
jgi:hypothetical protein